MIAVFIAINVGLALSVDYLPDSAVRPVIDLHKSIGITVLGLVILRILWRLSHRPPAFPAGCTIRRGVTRLRIPCACSGCSSGLGCSSS
jgi:cytochrome b561